MPYLLSFSNLPVLSLIKYDSMFLSDINECASNPCLHGATCLDLINEYFCGCVPGYTDVNCQTGIGAHKKYNNYYIILFPLIWTAILETMMIQYLFFTVMF
jgi:hypothetical protein